MTTITQCTPSREDAFGAAIFDYHSGVDAIEIVERDDGFITASSGPAVYFSEPEDWPEQEREALREARGRVLDIGCGAGRHCLHLQERGQEVVGIDSSPLAVRVCLARGVRSARVLAAGEIYELPGLFDVFLLMGNNLGLLADRRNARWLLERLGGKANANARLIGQSLNPDTETNPVHLAYHERNLARGRLRGQFRMRLRYAEFATPWHDYLFLSPTELAEICKGTGWTIESVSAEEQALYTATLRLTG